MEKTILETIVQKFVKFPGSMNSGNGKLAKRNKTTPDVIREAKRLANIQLGVVKIINITKDIIRFEEDVENKSATLTYNGPKEIKTKEDLIRECNIDEEKWEITKIIYNAWGKEGNQNWQVKAYLSAKKDSKIFQEEFQKFLENYSPVWGFKSEIYEKNYLPKACLLINKQDEHLNKLDTSGNNNIYLRFSRTFDKIQTILKQAALSNSINHIIYIIGSDEFNSEWTVLTTKGTPQQNILQYQEAFQLVCDYEAYVIKLLLESCPKIDVVYIPGNHDEYMGWHLITWLKAFFKNRSNVVFDTSPEYTKYIKYDNTAMMFNHGDAIKPQKLAIIFPQEFKEQWSSCDNFYIFTGDRHFEKSEDLGGIIFYQLPALSDAKSLWDKKNGYAVTKPELTVFLIEEGKGRTVIFKQPLN